MGASITYLSWTTYRENVVNIHDPGRLIQQSYYAGRVLSPIASVELGPRSKRSYRYWMVVGTEGEIGEAIDGLLEKYGEERVELVNP